MRWTLWRFNDRADELARGALFSTAEISSETEDISAFASSLSANARRPLLFCTCDGTHDASHGSSCGVCMRFFMDGKQGENFCVAPDSYQAEEAGLLRALEANIQLVHDLYRCRDLAASAAFEFCLLLALPIPTFDVGVFGEPTNGFLHVCGE